MIDSRRSKLPLPLIWQEIACSLINFDEHLGFGLLGVTVVRWGFLVLQNHRLWRNWGRWSGRTD
jgi:hypothetical protein